MNKYKKSNNQESSTPRSSADARLKCQTQPDDIRNQRDDTELVYTQSYPHPVDFMTEEEYNEYVRREVLKGIESAENEELIPHEEVFQKMRDLIESKKNNKKATTSIRMP